MPPRWNINCFGKEEKSSAPQKYRMQRLIASPMALHLWNGFRAQRSDWRQYVLHIFKACGVFTLVKVMFLVFRNSHPHFCTPTCEQKWKGTMSGRRPAWQEHLLLAQPALQAWGGSLCGVRSRCEMWAVRISHIPGRLPCSNQSIPCSHPWNSVSFRARRKNMLPCYCHVSESLKERLEEQKAFAWCRTLMAGGQRWSRWPRTQFSFLASQ